MFNKATSSGTNWASIALNTTDTTSKLYEVNYCAGISQAAGDQVKVVLTATGDSLPVSGTFRAIAYFIPNQP